MTKKDNMAKPFLKWAGGKTQLLSEIHAQIPYSYSDKFTYIEPFVGSGAVLFWILNNFKNIENAIINDINEDLINCYQVIKTSVKELIRVLSIFLLVPHKNIFYIHLLIQPII